MTSVMRSTILEQVAALRFELRTTHGVTDDMTDIAIQR